MSCVCHAFVSVHCCLVVICWVRADLLALVCDFKLCFCHFPKWYPGSGVVLDFIDFRQTNQSQRKWYISESEART